MARNATLAVIRRDVQNQADTAGLTTRHPDALIDRLINQSIQRFRERITIEGAQHYLTNTTGLFTAGATSPFPFFVMDLSAAAPAIVRIHHVTIDVAGRHKTLVHVPFREYTKWSGADVTGEPIAWANYQTTGLAIMPAPDQAYAWNVWYLPVLDDLEDDTDEFNGVAGWEDFIVWDVVCRLIVRDQYPQAYAMAENSKQEIWRDIVRAATKVTLAGGHTVGRDSFGERLHVMGVRAPERWGGR